MKTWISLILTIPADYVSAANKLAYIFDFDIGGDGTFGNCKLSPTGEAPATHYMASTQFNIEYLDYITSPTEAMAALTTLAQEYGRELPQQEDVDAWCENVIIGEPEGLLRITEEVEI